MHVEAREEPTELLLSQVRQAPFSLRNSPDSIFPAPGLQTHVTRSSFKIFFIIIIIDVCVFVNGCHVHAGVQRNQKNPVGAPRAPRGCDPLSLLSHRSSVLGTKFRFSPTE